MASPELSVAWIVLSHNSENIFLEAVTVGVDHLQTPTISEGILSLRLQC